MEYKKTNLTPTLSICPITTILKNILISYGITLVLFLIFAFVITYTSISTNTVSAISVVITIISILTAGILNGKKTNSKGWLTGCITGFVYMFILFIAGGIIYKNFNISLNGIIMCIVGVFSGTVGSIIGINNKK